MKAVVLDMRGGFSVSLLASGHRAAISPCICGGNLSLPTTSSFFSPSFSAVSQDLGHRADMPISTCNFGGHLGILNIYSQSLGHRAD